MRKGLWSPDEDEKLKSCIAEHRSGSWSDIARKAGLQRCGKSCRRRWMNHLRPDLKRDKFTHDEVKLVARLHETLGNKWSEIATYLVGRTDNDVKNLWNTQIKRQLRIPDDRPPLKNNHNILVDFPFSIESTLGYTRGFSMDNEKVPVHDNFPNNTLLNSELSNNPSTNVLDFRMNTISKGHTQKDELGGRNIQQTSSTFQVQLVNSMPETTSSDNGVIIQQGSRFFLDNYKLDHACVGHTSDIMHPIHTRSHHNQFYNGGSCIKMECFGKRQTSDSNESSSSSSFEGVGSSYDYNNGTSCVPKDTCIIGERTLFDLQKLDCHKGDDEYSVHEYKLDLTDVNCISRKESWSSTSCDEQWALETLYDTCEGYSKLIWD